MSIANYEIRQIGINKDKVGSNLYHILISAISTELIQYRKNRI